MYRYRASKYDDILPISQHWFWTSPCACVDHQWTHLQWMLRKGSVCDWCGWVYRINALLLLFHTVHLSESYTSYILCKFNYRHRATSIMTLYRLEVGQHWLYTMRMRLSSPNPFAMNVADGFGVWLMCVVVWKQCFAISNYNTIPYFKLYICIYVLCAFVYMFLWCIIY